MFDSSATSAPVLTDRQQAVLEVLRSHTTEHGYPPTVREIGEVLGMASSSTVHSHLAALERAGIIERDPTKPRALKWGPAAAALGIEDASGSFSPSSSNVDVDASVTMPLLGRVAAGAPILAEEHVEEYVPVPKQLTRAGDSFLLKVRGDSMEGAGILDGDWVVVRHQRDANDGEIVVALVGEDEEATCKRLRRINGRIELHSENDAYEPIVPDAVEFAGIVTGVMRAICTVFSLIHWLPMRVEIRTALIWCGISNVFRTVPIGVQMQQESSDATHQIVAFTVAGVEYAFRIEAVKEIIRFLEPQPTSSEVPWMRGVINLRGSIVPIIDLGARLGRATGDVDPKSAKILVLEDTARTIGAVVTTVDEVRTIDSAQVQPAPTGAGSSFIESVVTVDDRLIMLLDASQLLAIEEAQAAA